MGFLSGFLLLSSVFLLGASSCSTGPMAMDGSAYALESGQATMLLGGCTRDLVIGYDACWFEKGATLPKLHMVFTNPAEYAVSDCNLGIYQTGSVAKAGVVDVSLAKLSTQLNETGFCMLRVEVVEYYPDPKDNSQIRQIPMAGGWFIEMFDKGYMAIPPKTLTGWCYIVRRTTAGRTVLAPCK